MKNVIAALAALGAATTVAQAATITGSQLTGVTSGNATVFKIDLSASGLSSLSGITIEDSNDVSRNGSNPLFSGLDLDAIWISTVDCADVSCLGGASAAAAFDYENASFSVGSLISGSGDPFGVSGGQINHSIATLGSLDAVMNATTQNGLFSTGLGGIIGLDLLSALNLLTGNYFLYIAEVGGGGAEFDFQRVSLEESLGGETLVNPVPAALPLMLTGLFGFGFFGRNKRNKSKV